MFHRGSKVLLCALVLAAAATCLYQCKRASPRPNVILITVDTLRRDHLDLYGYSRRTAPNVTALAKEGVTFDDAITPIPKTAPALASLLTGLFPHTHRLLVNYGSRLDAGFLTFAEVLQSNGYRTAAFVSNHVLVRNQNHPAGLDQGFEVYDDKVLTPDTRSPDRSEILERRAEPNTDAALAWLEANGDKPAKPLFLWVHYIDPHGLYDPPEPYRSQFQSATKELIPILDPDKKEVQQKYPWLRLFYICPYNLVDDLPQNDPGHDLNLHVDRYDGEIAYADAQIGRLLDALRRLRLLDDALVIFAADHGESLGEHGVYFEHGFDLYEENLRVPLVLRYPGTLPAGRRVSGLVQLGDVLPTVLDLLDISHPSGVEGESFLTAAQGKAAIRENREIAIQTNEGLETLEGFPRGIRSAHTKCIVTFSKKERTNTGEPKAIDSEQYDLDRDPAERRNVFDPRSKQSQALAASVTRLAFPSDQALALQAVAYLGGKNLDLAAKRFEEWRASGGKDGAAYVVNIGPGVLPFLCEWLARETDPNLLALEGEAVRAMPSPQTVDLLVPALSEAASKGRPVNEEEIRRSLQAMSHERVIAAMTGLLERDTDARVRAAAAAVLGYPSMRGAITPLAAALDDPDPTVRIAIIRALLAFPIPADRKLIRSNFEGRLPAETDEGVKAALKEASDKLR